MVECQFSVIGLSGQSENGGVYVILYGVQGEPFGEYTPIAKCEMLIKNPAASDQFELGAKYRVTFEKIEDSPLKGV